ncbi:DUF2267 domain-containing protein [Streptomyces spongiae]|uniref:DUF2267 domain-containing protein n=1 Tax=Streptomyces spongiae TaxID=565072 RepID=A0A5N8XYI7_9ACTN|nr:DUF2267 domain-containing protein [Streptomyces spongiae]MPY63775.1 DUF2267 domain-containing protein [Streptomyces spongiae]
MTPTTRPQSSTTPTTPRDPVNTPSARSTWEELVEAVRATGRYRTTAEAARVTRVVLSALGGQLTGDERAELARSLPEEAARPLASEVPLSRPLTAPEFVDNVATRIEGATPDTARWDVSSVLGTLPQRAGTQLIDRVLTQLPPGYALLFGIPKLTPAS